MAPVSDAVDFECSHCGYSRRIARDKFHEGKTRFRMKCPRCQGESIVDLALEPFVSAVAILHSRDLPRLQRMIDNHTRNGTLALPPGEFLGQVVIDKPITLEGKGKATWIGSTGPATIRVTSHGVVIRNVMVEVTTDRADVAIEATPGTQPLLENVILRGITRGVPQGNISEVENPPIVFTLPPVLKDTPGEDSVEIFPETVSAPGYLVEPALDNIISSRFVKALAAEKRQDWQAAVEIYRDILALAPAHPDAEKLLERACRESGTSQVNQ